MAKIFNLTNIIAVILLAVIGYTGYYSYTHVRDNQDEIILQLEEIIDYIALPYKIARLSAEHRDTELLLPIKGLDRKNLVNNWGDPRDGGRSHEGIDIFASRGTPIFSATEGYVRRVGVNDLGGNVVWITGKGGVRYYYAHMDRQAMGLKRGDYVTTDTVLGYVGNTGNASNTPPHLHFGMYFRGAENPFSLFIIRE